MRPILIALMVIFLSSAATYADDRQDVSTVLDGFHGAAATADWDTYFGLMTDDSIFLGTDAGERWDKPTFQGYASQAPNGWRYDLKERHINFTPDGNTAWFDEILVNKKYGTSRGTGVVIRTPSGWRIAQYHLTFPIPNDLADGITQQIQTFEQRQNSGQ